MQINKVLTNEINQILNSTKGNNMLLRIMSLAYICKSITRNDKFSYDPTDENHIKS